MGKVHVYPTLEHVPSTSAKCAEHREAIYLFQVTPCSHCGTILCNKTNLL